VLITAKGILQTDLGDPPVIYRWSPRRVALSAVGPLGVCWHETEAHGCEAMANRLKKLDPNDQVSWHLLIGRDGVVWQSVPLIRGAWHIRKKAPNTLPGKTQSARWYLLGVEMEHIAGENYTAEQVDTLARVVAAFRAWHPEWPRRALEWGHAQFDPERRRDPSPEFRSLLAGILDRSSEA